MPLGRLSSRTFDVLRRRLPSECAVCRGWGAARVCDECLTHFTRDACRCRRCAVELPAGTQACGDCIRRAPAFDGSIAALSYAFPWDGLVSDFKFRSALDLAPLVSDLLSQAVARAAPARPDWVLPVPLGVERLRERGYNQAWELARRVAARAGWRADASLLHRVRQTPQQASLAREQRAANVRGAFAVDPHKRHLLPGAQVAVVDDVMTTGATADEVARVLKQAGAAGVEVWVLARTPVQ
jgi:ComF family protein